jgi:hypothetical protein
MLYSAGKSVYSIFTKTLCMFETFITFLTQKHFTEIFFRESDDPHIFVDLLVSTSNPYASSSYNYIIYQHIYSLLWRYMDNVIVANLLFMQYVAAAVIDLHTILSMALVHLEHCLY